MKLFSMFANMAWKLVKLPPKMGWRIVLFGPSAFLGVLCANEVGDFFPSERIVQERAREEAAQLESKMITESCRAEERVLSEMAQSPENQGPVAPPEPSFCRLNTYPVKKQPEKDWFNELVDF